MQVWVKGEAYTGFWWRNPSERGHLEDPDVDGGINIKMDLQEVGWEAWNRSIGLRIWTGGRHL